MSADEHFAEGRKVRRRSGSAFGAVDFELCTVPANGWVSAEQLAKELNSCAALLAENEKLREALKTARDAIAAAPIEAFGTALLNGYGDSYPIQSELLSNLNSALGEPQ